MYKTILIPTDSTQCANHTVAEGLRLAKTFAAEVTFLHVLENPARDLGRSPYAQEIQSKRKALGERALAQAREQAEREGVSAKTVLVESQDAPGTILELEQQHDLTLLSTHARRGVGRFIAGSLAEDVLRGSSKPHYVVRCPEV